MSKKVLSCFIFMVFAITGLHSVSFADVEVGNNLSLFGDFRLRWEYDTRSTAITAVPDTADSRERARLRARIGAKYQTMIEALTLGMRLSTGSSLNSPHSNFSTAATAPSGHGDFMDLDRAYLTLKVLETGVLIVGKQAYPLWSQTEQAWDRDISPEGFAAAYTAIMEGMGNFTVAGAYYYITNNGWSSGIFDNDGIFCWQVLYTNSFDQFVPTLAFTGGNIIDGDDSGNFTDIGGSGFGSTNTPGFYMFSAQAKTNGLPATYLVGLDYHFSSIDLNPATATLVGSTDDHDKGFVVQGRINYNPFGVRYYYYDIEELSVPLFFTGTGAVAYFTQDDFPSSAAAPTGFEGHRMQLDYKFNKKISADFIIYLLAAKTNNYIGTAVGVGEVRDMNRYQFNFNVKF